MIKQALLAVISLGSPFFVSAQQTIFNVPTTDIMDRGKLYVELDASFKTNDQAALGRFSSFVPRFVCGVGRGVEVGLNVTGNRQPGADSTTLVPTVKWRFYENKAKDIAIIAGTNLYIPVRNRAFKFGTYSYLALSKVVKKTRITVGGHVGSKGVFAAKAVRVGVQFGIEQTINGKLTIAADWLSGRHSSGYLTPGLIYKPNPRVTAYFSYSIGNHDSSRGNHYFLLELGYYL
jgi:hypothetical protein